MTDLLTRSPQIQQGMLKHKPHVRLSTGDVYCGPLNGITIVIDNVCLVCGSIDTPFDLGPIWTELRT